MFPYPLQWGPPTFSAGHSFAMMSAVIVSMVEVSIFIPNCSSIFYHVLFPPRTTLARQMLFWLAPSSYAELYYVPLFVMSSTSSVTTVFS